VFFVVTGVQFDVRSLLASNAALALLPALVGAILVVRGGPALLFRGRVGNRAAAAAGLLQATTLTFPVVVAEVGRSLGLLTAATAAALVSVLLFPALALALRPWSRSESQPEARPRPPATPESGPGPAAAPQQ
jgi:Kef-type K+ transport system membrane component KefB